MAKKGMADNSQRDPPLLLGGSDFRFGVRLGKFESPSWWQESFKEDQRSATWWWWFHSNYFIVLILIVLLRIGMIN